MTDQSLEQIIIRSLQEGVITIECNGVVSGVNPAAVRILGLNNKTIVGGQVDGVAPKTVGNKPFLDIFHSLVTEGAVTPHKEVELTRHDGRKIQVSASSAALDITECVPGMESYVVLFRDITAFKNLEIAKRKAADHLSHELKTPLSILKASLDNLLPLYKLNSKEYRLVERAERNLDRLLSIQNSVEQIFFPQKLYPQTIPVKDTINKILKEILRKAKHREMRLETKFDYCGSIFFDPNILETILTILVKNAVENTPDQGLVKVMVSELNSGHFEVSVHDYGVGIPFKDLEFIFEGFYHTQDTNEYSTKKPFDFNAGGKGLELFQLKNLSELHGFDIDFQSERCVYIPESTDHCPGRIDICPHVKSVEGCFNSGYSVFRVKFTNTPL